MIEPKKRSFQRIPFWELRGEFHSQGWFDQDIADAIGMTPGTLSTRMQGRSVWRADEISKICELLNAKRLKAGEKLSLNGLPASATGQYDRLYNAIRNGDTEEAAAARAKLEAMGKDDKTIYSQLKTRMKKYDGTIQRAAKAQVAGDDATRRKLTEDMVLELYETLGIDRTDKADAAKREQVIDLVTGAITDVANAQLKGGRAGLYDDLSDALDSGRVKDVQDELNRLMTAGKEAGSLKSKVTELVKPVYLAGNDHDRAQMEAMLLKLEDDSGGKLYERKNFEQWVKQAKKKEEQAEKTTDEWAGLR